MRSHRQCGDADRPASLSRRAVELAARLPGSPVVLSDDLEMGALSRMGSLPELVVEALRARNHGVLVCKAFDQLPAIMAMIEEAVERRPRPSMPVWLKRPRGSGPSPGTCCATPPPFRCRPTRRWPSSGNVPGGPRPRPDPKPRAKERLMTANRRISREGGGAAVRRPRLGHRAGDRASRKVSSATASRSTTASGTGSSWSPPAGSHGPSAPRATES